MTRFFVLANGRAEYTEAPSAGKAVQIVIPARKGMKALVVCLANHPDFFRSMWEFDGECWRNEWVKS